jgi:hypothetical protein
MMMGGGIEGKEEDRDRRGKEKSIQHTQTRENAGVLCVLGYELSELKAPVSLSSQLSAH